MPKERLDKAAAPGVEKASLPSDGACRQEDHLLSGNRHAIPSKPTPAAARIHAATGLSLTTTPYRLD